MKGTFDGLTEKEREGIKEIGNKAMQDYLKALKAYEEMVANIKNGSK
ncbi:hypothetical protein [Chryseobacterium lathyri]|nr:hypothetical protein [Chryseobacterium lathyri]